MTPLDVAALKKVAKEIRPEVRRSSSMGWDEQRVDWADAIEASIPTNPVIELTPEVKEAIEVAEGACSSVTNLVRGADPAFLKAAAVLRGLIREGGK